MTLSSNFIIDTSENNKSKIINHNYDIKIYAPITNMKRGTDSIDFAEYLNIAHKQVTQNKIEDNTNNNQINISDFIPEPKTISRVLKSSTFNKEKWGTAIKQEITSLFDIEIKDQTNNWSPTASVQQLKYFLADTIQNKAKVYQLDLI